MNFPFFICEINKDIVPFVGKVKHIFANFWSERKHITIESQMLLLIPSFYSLVDDESIITILDQ